MLYIIKWIGCESEPTHLQYYRYYSTIVLGVLDGVEFLINKGFVEILVGHFSEISRTLLRNLIGHFSEI